jgi:sialate O-acetylesterase
LESKRLNGLLFVFVQLLVFAQLTHAKVLLPQILSSNMVLQRDRPITIWGFAAPGEKINVKFANQTKHATTDVAGNWSVVLSALKTSAVPRSMEITGTNKIVLEQILVGEVWLCSGQSNMEYQMRKLIKLQQPKNGRLGFPSNEVAQAKNSNIRIFLVNRKTLSKPDSIHRSWSVAQDSALRAFSAVGYFFAKELQQQLGIPIGIISSAVSGSAIEPWIAKAAFDDEPFFRDQKIRNDPGKFYTPMIEPLSNFRIRGFLWYQGETNCFLNEKISYSYKLKTLINCWRKAWNDQQMPFYFVQIAPFNYSTAKGEMVLNEHTEPEFWEAQAQVLRIPNTGLVVTTDLNDNAEDLHPTYKWEIGRRLALRALAGNYGKKIAACGPIFQSVSYNENQAIVSFDATDGLKSIDGKALTGFEIADRSGKFYPALAKITGQKVVLSAPNVAKPVSIRFNWTESPSSNFYNRSNLPAMPFRSDNPLTNQFKPTYQQ